MRGSDRKSARKAASGNAVSRVSLIFTRVYTPESRTASDMLSWDCLQAQKEAKENAATPNSGKGNTSAPSSGPNSGPGSPRLTLSPRLPSSSAGNSVRQISNSNQRLGSGLLRQLDVSRSLHAESSQGAHSSEPGSPNGSVASESASIASESAALRRRPGSQQLHADALLQWLAEAKHGAELDTALLLQVEILQALLRAMSRPLRLLPVQPAEQAQLPCFGVPWILPCPLHLHPETLSGTENQMRRCHQCR